MQCSTEKMETVFGWSFREFRNQDFTVILFYAFNFETTRECLDGQGSGWTTNERVYTKNECISMLKPRSLVFFFFLFYFFSRFIGLVPYQVESWQHFCTSTSSPRARPVELLHLSANNANETSEEKRYSGLLSN